jgi:hypothetical protein
MTYDFTRDEQAAIKAAWATEHGRAALTVIMERLGMLHLSSFSPDANVTAFNEGRRFVAICVAHAINKPLKESDAGHDIDSRGPVPTATERATFNAAQRATGRKPARRRK